MATAAMRSSAPQVQQPRLALPAGFQDRLELHRFENTSSPHRMSLPTVLNNSSVPFKESECQTAVGQIDRAPTINILSWRRRQFFWIDVVK